MVSVPETGDRYFMLPLLDMWSDVFAVPGSRTTGSGAGAYALVGPGWTGDLPGDVERIEAPTLIVWAIGRTRTDGPTDYEAVHAIQDGFTATPLSRWPEIASPVETAPDPSIDMQTPPLEQVESLSGAAFFSRAAELLRRHRPHLVDQPILARMARLGLRAGASFDPEGVEPDVAAAIERAPGAAQRWMSEAQPRLYPIANGWGMSTFGIGVYGTDYLRRAVVARVGLGANLVEDAVYPVLYTDANGEVPTGDHAYVLRFEAGSLPPADGFWSVTMYDADGFPVPNSLERYALGDRDELVYGSDGSLELYVQHDDPGDDRRANWLPAPHGPLGITLRLYAPRPEVLDGRWTPPPLLRT